MYIHTTVRIFVKIFFSCSDNFKSTMSQEDEWKRPERYVPGPGMPKLPPHLRQYTGLSQDEVVQSIKKLPFFMTELDEADEETQDQIEALKALAYEGDPDEIATNFKNHGNECYREKRYKDAAEFYTKAIDVKCGVKDIDVACYSNRAACNLELKNYRRCINDCKLALMLDPAHAKCLYRSAKAYFAVDRIDECIDCIEYAKTQVTDSANLNLYSSLLAKAQERKAQKTRLAAQRAAEQEARESRQRNLGLALRQRDITNILTGRLPMDSLKLHLSDETDPASMLIVPLMFFYPLEFMSEACENVSEEDTLGTYVSQLLDPPPPWLLESDSTKIDKYKVSNVSIFAPTATGGLAKVGQNTTIGGILSKHPPVIPLVDGVARFFIVPKADVADWLKTWNKSKAKFELGIADDS